MLFSERFMEDLLSRFQSTRVSYELKPEEAEVIRAKFNAASSSLYHPARPAPVQPPSNAHSAREFRAWKDQHPSILEHFEDFSKLLQGKRLAVFLDYDGTLTPIVKDPDRAFMSSQMRAAVQTVAGLFPTSIISGRGREKVEGFVQLKELFYAGSHGMDIVGPQACSRDGHEQPLAFQPAAKYAPIMDAVYKSLVDRVEHIPGATVEHNKFCVSVHFRNCSPESYEHVVTAVKDTLNDHPDLRASRGRKVLEIQPQVDWGKGRALSHMLKALGLDDAEDVVPIYLGDDRTDEDAFKVLKERATGFGILISNKMKETDAKYTLTDPTEVMAFLTLLLKWGSTPDNAWHSHGSCTGWSPKQQAPPPPTQPQPCTPPRPRGHQHNGHMPDDTSDHAQDHRDDLQTPAERHLNGSEIANHAETSLNGEAIQGEAASSSSSPPTPRHSPTAFARVRQFHGLPASSDRAMPASQWLTKTDSVAPSKLEAAASLGQTASAQQQAESGHESPCQSSAAAQAAGQETLDEYSRMVGGNTAGCRQTRRPSREVCVKLMEAQGRPPTDEGRQAADEEKAREGEVVTPPSRTSLDHYLRHPYKGGASGESDHMGRWEAGEGVMPEKEVAQNSRSIDALQDARSSGEHSMASMPPYHNAMHAGQRLPEGKRLTALLLDKLQGHDAQRASVDEALSPPGLSSHSTSSMAGYQSPFESLAHEALSASEDTESIKAEIGSSASLNLAPSR